MLKDACISIHHSITFTRNGIDSQLGMVPNLHTWRVFWVGDVIMSDMKI